MVGARVLVEWVAGGVVGGELLATTGWVGRSGDVALAAIAVVVAGAAWARRSALLGMVAVAVASALLGVSLVAHASAPSTDPADVARLALPLRTRLVGRVVSAAVADRTVLVLDVVSLGRPPEAATGRVRVRVRGRTAVQCGDIVAVETTLRRPRNFENPGRFDMAGRLARRGVHVTASVWDPDDVVRLSAAPLATLTRWRDAVRATIDRMPDPDVAAILSALVLGDDTRVTPAVRDAFSRAGVIHVLSVSGLHVGIVAGALAGAFLWLASRSERVLLHGDPRKLAVVGGLAAAVVYGALTGLAVATVRALVMSGVVAAAVVLDRRASPWRAFAAAALAIAVAEPGAPAEASFQLSFASVGALLAGATATRTDEGWARRAGRASVAAWIGTAPLTALHFHQISLVGIVANPLVIPLFEGAAVLPGLAGAVLAPWAPSLALVAMTIASLPVRLALPLVRTLGQWSWAAVDVPIPNGLETMLLFGVLIGLRGRRGELARAVGTICLVGLALDAGWWAHERTARTSLRTTFLDVGQGDAAVVELPGGRVLVIDAGGFAGSDFDTGAGIVEPFLRSRKIARLDALVMSHAHPDHAGGLAHLVRHLAPAELWWSGQGEGAAWDEVLRALADTGTPVRTLHAGTRIPDFPEVDVLHPPAGWTAPSLNEGSLVLRVRDGGAAVLFTGDAERAAEAAMLERPDALAATVLKVPHHGSLTSSAPALVTAVGPRAAVVSAGADNRFGHPAPAVEERYRAAGIPFYRTDRCGAVVVEIAADGPLVTPAIAGCRGP
jgi:competence protein ComEC